MRQISLPRSDLIFTQKAEQMRSGAVSVLGQALMNSVVEIVRDGLMLPTSAILGDSQGDD